MNNYVLTIAFIVLISCNSFEKNPYNLNNHILNDSQENIDSCLVGDWGIYEHIISGELIIYNVCPRIKFNEDKTAIVTLPSGDKELYSWSTTNEILRLSYPLLNIADHYFESSEYKMEFEKKKNFIQLTIILKDNEKFILRK